MTMADLDLGWTSRTTTTRLSFRQLKRRVSGVCCDQAGGGSGANQASGKS